MINEFLTIALVPLLFGAFETNSFQNTLCNIQIFGLSDFIQCDKLRDSLILKGEGNVVLSLDNSTDTVTIEVLPTEINVQTEPWYGANVTVISNSIWFVSDGSITFNVTSTYP